MTSSKTSSQVNPYAWVILALVFFASVAAPLNMSKVPPLMKALMDHYSVTMTSAGWLMSIFAIIGVILALPSGFLLGKLGARGTGLVALGCLAGGSALGVLTDSFSLLLFSRVLEGIGMCFMTILAPAVISAWFPPEKRGLAMGIWAVWVPAGTIAIFILAPRIAAGFHWKQVWWLCAIYSGVLFVLYLFFFRTPPNYDDEKPAEANSGLDAMKVTMKKRDPWLLALSFACYNFVLIALSTYMPTYLNLQRGFTPETAGLLVSGMMGLSVITVILGGVVSDKLGTRKKLIVFPFLVVAGIMCFFYLPGYGIIATMWSIGIVGGLAMTPIFASATEIVPPHEAGTSLAILTLGQNAGMCLGPLFFAAVAENIGWVTAGYACVPFVLLAVISAWKMNVR